MIVRKHSIVSGKMNALEIEIGLSELSRIVSGEELIQNIVPHLSPEEREFLISGMTLEEQEEIFNEEL